MKTPPAPYTVTCTPDHVRISFPCPRQVLSSAVLNGGHVLADHIINMRVGKNPGGDKGPFESSHVTLQRYGRRIGCQGTTVGMMTAASMDSFRQVVRQEQGVTVAALITAGISNARRAGDKAECLGWEDHPPAAGTINIIILTNACLTLPALVEAVMVATEAKAAALQELDVRNPVTGSLATGTGTDATAVCSGPGPRRIRYCGKHTLFGELLATTVIQALTFSLAGKPAPWDCRRRSWIKANLPFAPARPTLFHAT